jgi:hypothetical protein
MGCCETKPLELIKQCLTKYYQKCIQLKLSIYSFDSGAKDVFAKRISKENNIPLDTAKQWIEAYKYYMVYIGWLYEPNKTFQRINKQTPNVFKNLALPYEILQVWRAHVLFMTKYTEFCKIVSNGQKEYIPFLPSKQIWKSQDIKELQTNFRINREMLLTFRKDDKQLVDSLFIFQSSYLKNRLHYNIEDGSPILNLITQRYEEELQKPDGVFSINTRNDDALKHLADRIETLMLLCIPKENINLYPSWNFPEDVNVLHKNKSIMFQNITLPSNFIYNFRLDHLLSEEVANLYVDEYRKFLFISAVTGSVQTPSEEIDLAWHYHIEHLEEYILNSQTVMEGKTFIHNPADGAEGEDDKYRGIYDGTLKLLTSYFGGYDKTAWKESNIRFNQVFRWHNHHMFIQRCQTWQKNNFISAPASGNFQQNNVFVQNVGGNRVNPVYNNNPNAMMVNPVYVRNNVRTQYIAGCWVGCGIVSGHTYHVGCGNVFIGCGNYYSGCGLMGCGAIVNSCSGCGAIGCGVSGCVAYNGGHHGHQFNSCGGNNVNNFNSCGGHHGGHNVNNFNSCGGNQRGSSCSGGGSSCSGGGGTSCSGGGSSCSVGGSSCSGGGSSCSGGSSCGGGGSSCGGGGSSCGGGGSSCGGGCGSG